MFFEPSRPHFSRKSLQISFTCQDWPIRFGLFFCPRIYVYLVHEKLHFNSYFN